MIDPITQYILQEDKIDALVSKYRAMGIPVEREKLVAALKKGEEARANLPKMKAQAVKDALADSLENVFPGFESVGMDPQKYADGIYDGKININNLKQYFARWNDIARKQGFEKGKTQGFEMGKSQGYRRGYTQGRGESTAGIKALATMAVVGLIAMVSYLAYKRFFSLEAQACSHLSGDEKTICMAKARMGAYSLRMRGLIKGQENCKYTKDPAKCRAKLAKKKFEMENKIRKVKNKIKK